VTPEEFRESNDGIHCLEYVEDSKNPCHDPEAYNIPANLDGSGHTLLLVEFGGYDPNDITGYEDTYSLSHTPLQNGSAETSGEPRSPQIIIIKPKSQSISS
jgi:hypothetical protein